MHITIWLELAWAVSGSWLVSAYAAGKPAGAAEAVRAGNAVRRRLDAYDEELCDTDEADEYEGNMVKDGVARAALSPGLVSWPKKVFVPYTDLCLTAHPDFQKIHDQTGTRFYVIAFIIGDASSCTAMWGNGRTLAQGPHGTVSIFDEINLLRSLNGDVVASLGGAIGPELAITSGCLGSDAVSKLKAAYDSVIDTYQLTHIDFDIEGGAISSSYRSTAWANRFQALQKIQAERPNLEIWWTLAILPNDGLTADGMNFLADLMKSGVRFDRFNVMTMDYGTWYSGGKTMHQCEQECIDALVKQMLSTAQSQGLASQYGWSSVADVYPVVGSTPMIGQNDQQSEHYLLSDAQSSLAIWQSTKPIGMISQWSMNRDLPCSDYAASPICSGSNFQTVAYEYAAIFGKYTSSDTGGGGGGSAPTTAAPKATTTVKAGVTTTTRTMTSTTRGGDNTGWVVNTGGGDWGEYAHSTYTLHTVWMTSLALYLRAS